MTDSFRNDKDLSKNESNGLPANGISQDYLHKIVSEAREKFNIPAIAMSVMNSEAILLEEIEGVRVSGKPAQATMEDYFHIGSCSKSILAVMVAKSIEQNLINWETRFFEVFPELKDSADSSYHDITLEDLFLCEAGIKAYTNAEPEPLPY